MGLFWHPNESTQICRLLRVDQRGHKETMKILNKTDFVPCFPQICATGRVGRVGADCDFARARRSDLHKDAIKNLLKSLQALGTLKQDRERSHDRGSGNARAGDRAKVHVVRVRSRDSFHEASHYRLPPLDKSKTTDRRWNRATRFRLGACTAPAYLHDGRALNS